MSPQWRTVAVNQQPGTGTDYPFVQPSDDIRYLLGDLFLAYPDPACTFRLPFRVSLFTRFGSGMSDSVSDNYSQSPGPHERDLIIVDADDRVVFDTTTAEAYSDLPWGNALNVVTWTSKTTTLRVTIHTHGPPGAPPRVIPDTLVPVNGVLDGRCLLRMPEQVSAIRYLGNLNRLTGIVNLQEGYNVQLRVVEPTRKEGARRVTQLQLRALPGDGLPVTTEDSCAPELVIRRINLVGPRDDGNLFLDAVGCYWLRPMVTAVGGTPTAYVPRYDGGLGQPAAVQRLLDAGYGLDDALDRVAMAGLQIGNDCGPCCTCDDYVRTYRGLSRLWDRFMALGSRAEAARDLHRKNIDRFKAHADCLRQGALNTVLAGESACMAFAGASFCNTTNCNIDHMVIRLTNRILINGQPGPYPLVTLRAADTYRNGSDTACVDTLYTPAGPWPIYDWLYDDTQYNSVSGLRTRLCFDGCSPGDQIWQLQQAVTVHYDHLTPVPDRALPCVPGNPVTVPTWVSDIWTAEGREPAYPAYHLQVKTVPLNSGGA